MLTETRPMMMVKSCTEASVPGSGNQLLERFKRALSEGEGSIHNSETLLKPSTLI